MSKARCNLLVIRSKDLKRAARFYEAIGLQFTKHSHGNGPEHYANETEILTFEIYPQLENGLPTTETRIGFEVADIDHILDQLTEAGGDIISLPKNSEWGRRAVVRDPDGHKVELTQAEKLRSAIPFVQ